MGLRLARTRTDNWRLRQDDLEKEIEHGRVGGPGGQGGDRVAGADRAQFPQQPGDLPRVVEAGLVIGVAGQQGSDRVVAPGRPRRLSPPPDPREPAAAALGQGLSGLVPLRAPPAPGQSDRVARSARAMAASVPAWTYPV